jgi:uncharacterized protein YdaU (DUF1376 family)
VNYYRRYSGDYLRDTARLSMVEHGAYSLMLDYYYSDERPLPLDRDELYLMLRAMKPGDRAAVDKVLSLYFTKQADGWHQKRCDHEILVSKKARANGKEGGRPVSKPATGSVTETITGLVTGSVTEPETETLTGSGHPPTTNQKTRSKDLSVPDDFARFWAAYPRKDAKAKALPAFRRQKAGAVLDRILADIASRRQEWADPQFIPMPATYLNARRWEDEREHLATGEAFGGGGL